MNWHACKQFIVLIFKSNQSAYVLKVIWSFIGFMEATQSSTENLGG